MKNSHSKSGFFNANMQIAGALPYPRTDLACESCAASENIPGTVRRRHEKYGLDITDLQVQNEEGVKHTGQRIGRYTTIACPPIRYWEEEQIDNTASVLSALLRDYAKAALGAPITSSAKVLIAGLGNRDITADAVGPRTADKITVTGHLKDGDEIFKKVGCCRIFAMHPGVQGQTGIEAARLIQSAAAALQPDIVIAVDALAARSTSRLAATIQITDTGIRPGSGIGSRLEEISRDTVGCAVIAVGVPTIVDSSTLLYDVLERAGTKEIRESLQEILQNERSFFVSPRDSDVIIEEVSTVLSKGINKAFFAFWA